MLFLPDNNHVGDRLHMYLTPRVLLLVSNVERNELCRLDGRAAHGTRGLVAEPLVHTGPAEHMCERVTNTETNSQPDREPDRETDRQRQSREVAETEAMTVYAPVEMAASRHDGGCGDVKADGAGESSLYTCERQPTCSYITIDRMRRGGASVMDEG